MIGPPNDGVLAWTHAKSGIARSGASRAGFYLYNVSMMLTRSDGSLLQDDYVPYILHGSLRITHGSNDERDTCSFTLIPSCPLTPKAGQRVIIRLGGSSDPEFTGQVMIVQHRRREMNRSPWYDVQCVDQWFRFDARLVTWDWAPDSASNIAYDLVSRFCPGFTTQHVPAGLPHVERLTIINERPSTILRSLASTMNGGFRLDETGDLHLWTGPYETGPGAGTEPQPLTDTLQTLKAFTRTYDASNLRTRSVVEGMRTDLLTAIPAGADGSQFGRIVSIPVTDSSFFGIVPTASTDPFRLLRIGPQVMCLDTRASYIPVFDPVKNLTGGKLIADTSPVPESSGLVIYNLDTVTWAQPYVPGWFRVADQVVYIELLDPLTNRMWTRLANWPTFGALQAPVGTGATMVALPQMVHVLTWEEKPEWARVKQPVLAQQLNAPVVSRVHVEDDMARSEWALIESSDGVHESLIQDGRLSDLGAKQRAVADLTDFARPVLTIDWETDDLNARPGRRQIVNLGPPDPLSIVMEITHAELNFLVANKPPRRTCQASPVKVAWFIDFVLTKNTLVF